MSLTRAPRLDERPLKKRVGLVILATDHTTEPDFRRMVASDRIGIYVGAHPLCQSDDAGESPQHAAVADRGCAR